MTNHLPGVTHLLVRVPNRDDARASGVRAVVDLCYGPGDETAIRQVCLIKHGQEPAAWQVPHMPDVQQGRTVMVPVFSGEMLTQLCQTGARALEYIRRDLGTPQYGKRYRVFMSQNHDVKVVEEAA